MAPFGKSKTQRDLVRNELRRQISIFDHGAFDANPLSSVSTTNNEQLLALAILEKAGLVRRQPAQDRDHLRGYERTFAPADSSATGSEHPRIGRSRKVVNALMALLPDVLADQQAAARAAVVAKPAPATALPRRAVRMSDILESVKGLLPPSDFPFVGVPETETVKAINVIDVQTGARSAEAGNRPDSRLQGHAYLIRHTDEGQSLVVLVSPPSPAPAKTFDIAPPQATPGTVTAYEIHDGRMIERHRKGEAPEKYDVAAATLDNVERTLVRELAGSIVSRRTYPGGAEMQITPARPQRAKDIAPPTIG